MFDFVKKFVSTPVPQSKSEDGKIRLNLGCGDKLLKDYINIDIAPSRKGKRPDYISDIRKLKLPDNFANEILTVHVIEHFYYWEAESLLKEWIRVLKPGGRLIIECPNLLSAAQNVINDPLISTGPGREGQTTMWVLYGDPSWRDPLMCHRWAYTPHSLMDLLTRVGLIEVSQQPAQFKMKEPRDMRVIGRKPKNKPPVTQ